MILSKRFMRALIFLSLNFFLSSISQANVRDDFAQLIQGFEDTRMIFIIEDLIKNHINYPGDNMRRIYFDIGIKVLTNYLWRLNPSTPDWIYAKIADLIVVAKERITWAYPWVYGNGGLGTTLNGLGWTDKALIKSMADLFKTIETLNNSRLLNTAIDVEGIFQFAKMEREDLHTIEDLRKSYIERAEKILGTVGSIKGPLSISPSMLRLLIAPELPSYTTDPNNPQYHTGLSILPYFTRSWNAMRYLKQSFYTLGISLMGGMANSYAAVSQTVNFMGRPNPEDYPSLLELLVDIKEKMAWAIGSATFTIYWSDPELYILNYRLFANMANTPSFAESFSKNSSPTSDILQRLFKNISTETPDIRTPEAFTKFCGTFAQFAKQKAQLYDEDELALYSLYIVQDFVTNNRRYKLFQEEAYKQGIVHLLEFIETSTKNVNNLGKTFMGILGDVITQTKERLSWNTFNFWDLNNPDLKLELKKVLDALTNQANAALFAKFDTRTQLTINSYVQLTANLKGA